MAGCCYLTLLKFFANRTQCTNYIRLPPQTNGITERFHRTLSNMVSVTLNHPYSDTILRFVVFAHNSAVERLLPIFCFLVFGRQPPFVLDTAIFSAPVSEQAVSRLNHCRRLVRLHIEACQHDRKLRCNTAPNVPPTFRPG